MEMTALELMQKLADSGDDCVAAAKYLRDNFHRIPEPDKSHICAMVRARFDSMPKEAREIVAKLALPPGAAAGQNAAHAPGSGPGENRLAPEANATPWTLAAHFRELPNDARQKLIAAFAAEAEAHENQEGTANPEPVTGEAAKQAWKQLAEVYGNPQAMAEWIRQHQEELPALVRDFRRLFGSLYAVDRMAPTRPRIQARRARRFGCLGKLLLLAAIALCVPLLFAPWALHIGGRWTPLMTWWGVGRLRDSAGAQYGLSLHFSPDLEDLGGSGRGAWPSNSVRGKARVCSADGAMFDFDLIGGISGAWLDTDGKEMSLSLSEPQGSKTGRAFSLTGAWHGPDLVLDDRKTMFMHFLPGSLTPSRGYTSPVPEKHATVTLSWGTAAEFESLCASLSR